MHGQRPLLESGLESFLAAACKMIHNTVALDLYTTKIASVDGGLQRRKVKNVHL